MKELPMTNLEQDFFSFNTLLEVMHNDPLINAKIITLLKLDSYQRRSILNYWLEQMRRQNAHENLQLALGCLFDDKIAAQVLEILCQRQI